MLQNYYVLSAPFGNYFNYPGATSTLGTFTRHHRGGLLYRAWRCLLTLRYHRKLKGWTNKLGLPNPGLSSLSSCERYQDRIISIHGFSQEDWYWLVFMTMYRGPQAIEFNLSCPNVDHRAQLQEVLPAIENALKHSVPVIAKLPPLRWMEWAVPLYQAGVRCFHACNTIPTPGGGISGKPLKQYSLWAVEELKQKWGEQVKIIGGGGVTCHEDVLEYKKAGADHVAIGSALLNPFRWKGIKKLVARPISW